MTTLSIVPFEQDASGINYGGGALRLLSLNPSFRETGAFIVNAAPLEQTSDGRPIFTHCPVLAGIRSCVRCLKVPCGNPTSSGVQPTEVPMSLSGSSDYSNDGLILNGIYTIHVLPATVTTLSNAMTALNELVDPDLGDAFFHVYRISGGSGTTPPGDLPLSQPRIIAIPVDGSL